MECESMLFVKNHIPYLWDLLNSFSNSFSFKNANLKQHSAQRAEEREGLYLKTENIKTLLGLPATSSNNNHIQWSMTNHVLITSSNFALYTSHCWAMLLAPFASSFWAYSATFSSISRSFLRLPSSISVFRGVSTVALGCSSGLFGESSLTGGLMNTMVTNKFFFSPLIITRS